MNLARLFSFTRLIQQTLDQERLDHKATLQRLMASHDVERANAFAERRRLGETHERERAEWTIERQHLINSVFLKHGTAAPFVNQQPRSEDKKKRPAPRVGPYQILAGNAHDEEEQTRLVDQTVTAPELPPLSEGRKDEIRAAATARGLIKDELQPPSSNGNS